MSLTMAASLKRSTCFVLMPGLDGSGELFSAFCACLPQDSTCLILTYPQEPDWQWQDYVSYAEQQLTGTSELVLIAESFSGPIAIQLAHLLGNRCRALILAASFCSCPNSLLKFSQFLWPALPFKLAPARLLAPLLFTGASAEIVRTFQIVWQNLPSSLLRSRLQLLAQLDKSTCLAELQIPVLYLQATRDRLLGAEVLRQLKLARADLPIIAINAPHGILQTEAETCWHQIDKYLAKLSFNGVRHVQA